jgi:hypothetical protein
VSKFLPNLLVQIFKALVYSKIQFFIQKRIFLRFRPIRPSPARAGRRIPAQPIRPKQPWRICRKVYFLRLCAFRQRCLLSLTSQPCGPRLSASSPSPRSRSHSRCRVSSSPPATLRRLASNIEIPSKVFTPHLDSPPPLTPH